MFAKLKHKFDRPLYRVTERIRTFTGKDWDGEEKGTFYDIIWSPDRDNYFSVIPRKYWDDFHLTLITVNHELPPHVDSNIVSTINFYFETQDCVTTFYRAKIPDPDGYWMTNQTDGHCYYETDLEPIGSFVAEPGDAYLLDIKQIHGVKSPTPLGPDRLRKAVTIGSLKHDYDTVFKMLQDTNSI